MSIAMNSDHDHNGTFDLFGAAVARRFASIDESRPLFTVDAGDLYSLYLATFREGEERQHYTCSCCRQFIQRFGNLAVIEGDGSITSVMWGQDENLPEIFRSASAALARAVGRGPVSGVFVSNEQRWGTPVTGGVYSFDGPKEWHHFAVTPQPSRLHRDRLPTPHQVMAQKKQDFGTLSHGLADFSRETVAAAVNLLEAEAMYRGEKVIGPARFLLDLHDKIATYNGERRRNLIWRAVATAPVGFATPRSSMVGTLLEDLAEGMSVEVVQRRFADKMHPLQSQRPQAAPTAGNIVQAESIVAKLGLAPALRRRFARLEEIKAIWKPQPARDEPAAGGVFGHLKAGQNAPSDPNKASVTSITWVKFEATVLPKAKSIKVLVKGLMNFAGVVTAVDPDAPPILQWDREGERNPVSWYVWNGGSSPISWRLPDQAWIEATGIMLKPSMWSGEDRASHQGKGAVIILDGAKETRTNAGLALFPECLRSELHSIRATIEAFSKRGQLEGADEGSANGLMVGDRGLDAVVNVVTDLGSASYKIDRWD